MLNNLKLFAKILLAIAIPPYVVLAMKNILGLQEYATMAWIIGLSIGLICGFIVTERTILSGHKNQGSEASKTASTSAAERIQHRWNNRKAA